MRIFSVSTLLVLLLNGCIAHKQLVNYKGELPNSQNIKIENLPDIKIQSNDVLSIKVHSTNLETAAPFNIRPVDQGGSFVNIESMQLDGYLVDQEGIIDFPVLGKLELQGLSISEAREMVKEKLKDHLKNPVVNIRLLNFMITVTGEVNNPGSFTIVNERISLPDALALAGDLTGHANRRNILLVREKEGYRSLERIDLQSVEFFNSEFYYLKQNDLIYVEPIRAKTGAVQDQTSKTVPIIGVAATLLAIIVGLVIK